MNRGNPLLTEDGEEVLQWQRPLPAALQLTERASGQRTIPAAQDKLKADMKARRL